TSALSGTLLAGAGSVCASIGSTSRMTGSCSRLDIVWMANCKAYIEGLEGMSHRCSHPTTPKAGRVGAPVEHQQRPGNLIVSRPKNLNSILLLANQLRFARRYRTPGSRGP